MAMNSETYAAFKTRKLREFDRQHGHRPHCSQQRLLRVHLQHFLVTFGAQVSTEQSLPDADSKASERTFLKEQKKIAVVREKTRKKRHKAARSIQRAFRRRLKMWRKAELENEVELLSTSEFVPLEVKRAPAELIDTSPKALDVVPSSGLSRADLPAYEVVLEVVAARDFALNGATSDGYLEAKLVLKEQGREIARVLSPRQQLLRYQEEELQWQDTVLRFGFDPAMDGIVAQKIIDEWIATVTVRITTSGGVSTMLGVVEIPMSLLEPPLAADYALCRWFPLSRAFPGHIARGELRARVAYLMQQRDSDAGHGVMVPYVCTDNPVSSESALPPPQPQRKRISQRKRPMTNRTARKSELPKPPTPSANPGRISRAEALSPPSSPSSVASSEAGEAFPVAGPSSPWKIKTNRRPDLPKRPQKYSKPVKVSPRSDEVVEDRPETPKSPAKPVRSFLKRKPYKVVFEKLDWSGVSAKTDSNLSSSTSRLETGPTRTNRSESRVLSSSTQSGVKEFASDGSNANVARDSPPAGGFIDEATTQRLAALETAVFERCRVTQDTAPLARFKYQTERKKFVDALQAQPPTCTSNTMESPGQPSGEQSMSSTAMELWKKLTGDSSGQLYASMLRHYSSQQPTAFAAKVIKE